MQEKDIILKEDDHNMQTYNEQEYYGIAPDYDSEVIADG